MPSKKRRLPKNTHDNESYKGSDDSSKYLVSNGSFTPKKESVFTGIIAVIIFAVAQGFCDVTRRISTEKQNI